MASTPISPEDKACSFANGYIRTMFLSHDLFIIAKHFSVFRWLSADDHDQMCMCCDSTCGSSREGRAELSDSGENVF